MTKNKDLFAGTEILFADGKTRVIKPLTIRQLRKFMKAVKDLNTEEGISDEDIDVMIEAAAIALATVDPELAEDPDALEDILDLRSFGELMSAAMGSDPSL
ncbi:MAG: hypothetical protein ACO3YX_03560 [Candidatus Nanopelagicaceae bacterium]